MQKETAMGTSSQDVYDNAQRLIVCNSFTNIKNKYFKYNHLQDCDSIYKEIQQFFKNHENKEKCNFRTYCNPFIGLYIEEDDLNDLIELLARYSILDDETPEHAICIGRKQEGLHKLMIDIDIKTSISHSVKKDGIHVWNEYWYLFYKLAEAIAKHIGSTNFKVFTRQEYFCKKDNVYKNGAHVIFTDIVIESGKYKEQLHSEEIDKCIEDIYQIDTVIDKNDIIDQASFGNTILGIIGSRKPESHQYFRLILSEDSLKWRKIVKISSENNLIERCEDIKDSLLFPDGSEKFYEVTVNKNESVKTSEVSNNYLTSVVNLINKEYITQYDSWIKIGMAIKNSGGSIELYDEISKKAKNYSSFENVKQKWDSFKSDYNGKKVTFGTLSYYARLSNPTEYDLLTERNKTLEYIVNNYTDCIMIDYLCDNKHSESYKFIKNLMCICSKENNRTNLCATWYYYNGVYYKQIDEGIVKENLFQPLYNKINKIYKDYKEVHDLLQKYEDSDKSEIKQMKNSKNVFNIKEIIISSNNNKKKLSTLKKIYQNLYKKAQLVRDKIGSNDERIKLLTVLQDKMILKKEDFIEKWNNKPSTTVFENGVYDAYEKKMIIDTNNTLSCKKNFTEPTQEVIDLFDNYMKSLFTDIRIRELVYKLIAKMLTPDHIQYIIFFTGIGSNGKSKFIEFLTALLGDYFTAVSGSFFSGEVKKGSCDPELVKTIHKRCVSVNEPIQGVRLSGNYIKSLTGDDIITARELYKDPVSWKPSAKHIITCNDMPSTDDISEGFKRRLIVIPFTTRFLSEESYKTALENNEPDIAKINDEMLRELFKQDVLDQIATLLVTKYYDIRNVYDLPEPCKKFKENYIHCNDPFIEWLNECTIFDENSGTPLKDLYVSYKTYVEENTNDKKLTKGKFEEKLKNTNKCKVNHHDYIVYGITLKSS